MKSRGKAIENIKWTLLVKRLGGFMSNYVILFVPILILAIIVFELERDFGFLNSFDDGSGFWWFEILFATIYFPLATLIFFQCHTISEFMIEIYLIIPVFISFLGLETLTALIFRNDIGSLPFGLIIVDKHGNRASRWRVVLRTFLKYLTVFLCPILLLFPMFNRRNACLHELISGAYKVEKPKPVYPPMYYPPQQQ